MSKLADLMKDIKAKAVERKALAKDLASKHKSIRMHHESGHKVLVGPDMSKPGTFRVTRFDEKGDAMGHTEHPSLEHATDEALRNGFKPK
jgi:hypothetical protein